MQSLFSMSVPSNVLIASSLLTCIFWNFSNAVPFRISGLSWQSPQGDSELILPSLLHPCAKIKWQNQKSYYTQGPRILFFRHWCCCWSCCYCCCYCCCFCCCHCCNQRKNGGKNKGSSRSSGRSSSRSICLNFIFISCLIFLFDCMLAKDQVLDLLRVWLKRP